MSNIDNIFFDISKLKVDFNKKINLNDLFLEIMKKFSVNEIIKYAFVSYYKSKQKCVLITFTNEKVFISSNKKDLSINGIYNYQDIKGFEYIKGKFWGKLVVKMSFMSYTLKHVSKTIFDEMLNIFDQEKTIFINSKIGQNIMQSTSVFNSLDFIKNNSLNFNKEEKEDKENNFDDSISNNFSNSSDKNDLNSSNNFIKKTKRVVNDEMISKNTSLSSTYLIDLFSNENSTLPNNKNTIFKELLDRVKVLENSNIFIKPFDSIPLKFTTNSKLNTIPVLAEFSSLSNVDKIENRLLFSRNWIEFTKHNVKNKLLGVDEKGNGTYIDLLSASKTKIIDHYKAKDYLVNQKVRHGLRSHQTVYYYDQNNKQGLESLYYNSLTNEKLNIAKYDGIFFKNQKHYFNLPSEFNLLQKKHCKIQIQEYESDFKSIKLYELIFDENTISYNVYDFNKGIINDDVIHAHSYDLKMLTFFKD